MTPTIVLLVLTLAVVAIYLARQLSVAQRRASVLEASLASTTSARAAAERLAADLEQRAAELQAAVDRLTVYSAVADAVDEATRILSEAHEAASQVKIHAAAIVEAATREASATREQALEEARQIRASAQDRARSAKVDADSLIQAAGVRAQGIVDQAERRAEEIAGEALRAMRAAEQWEQTVAAMKNVVDGYGNRYVIPTHSLLDDIAEAFGHTEAGQQLKIVRDQIRRASAHGTAAVCDYVENNRRQTAIRFVTDAFNGKADSIIARAKIDNIGTLQRELRDAFQLVNHNGTAFRNARVRDEYLALRLEELRLAGVMEALRQEEREQQRLIKERIREEEKARREIERALRESAKEEEILRRAMAKAEEKLLSATAAQRETYERQLEELTAKLHEAEERNQRAKSMAELTRRGHVYIVSNIGSLGEHVYKIGMTRRLDPVERVRELGDSSVPFEFDVHAMIFSEDAPSLENRLHKHFALGQVNKVNHRKEFFRLNLSELRSEVEQLGISAHWTMTAAARQYRETLAIEEIIGSDEAARDAWLRRTFLLEDSDDAFETDETEGTVAAPELYAVLIPGSGAGEGAAPMIVQ